ncbi:TPA: hypothetical protein ACHO0Z_003721, partial [Klebsiella pneumoniae]
ITWYEYISPGINNLSSKKSGPYYQARSRAASRTGLKYFHAWLFYSFMIPKEESDITLLPLPI